MEPIRAELEPTTVIEWDAEDEVSGVLAEDTPVAADDALARAMLNELTINLPKALEWTELVQYVRRKQPRGDFRIPPDIEHYDYYATEIPLTLIVPSGKQLVRLKLVVNLDAKNSKSDPAVAYDLFPSPQVDVRKIMSGDVKLDVAEGLQFALLAAGVPKPVAGITKCLGLNLNLPFQWTSRTATIQCSGRMSNPAEWSVTDDAIETGFSASLIVRAPKDKAVTISASLYGELREKILRVFSKTQFRTFAPHTYRVG